MFDREPPQYIPSYRPSDTDWWLRGYARAYQGLPADAPDDERAGEAYCKGFAVGTADRDRTAAEAPEEAQITESNTPLPRAAGEVE